MTLQDVYDSRTEAATEASRALDSAVRCAKGGPYHRARFTNVPKSAATLATLRAERLGWMPDARDYDLSESGAGPSRAAGLEWATSARMSPGDDLAADVANFLTVYAAEAEDDTEPGELERAAAKLSAGLTMYRRRTA